MKIENLTFETLVAYILPAFLLGSIYLPILDHYGIIDRGFTSISEILLVVVLTILVGILVNMASTVFLSGFVSKSRDFVFYGTDENPSLLTKKMEEYYPHVSDEEWTPIIYALFSRHVQGHVYTRRNYDWYFFMASRNLLVAFLILIPGLIWHAYAVKSWPVELTVIILLLSAGMIAVLLVFMKKALAVYYGYYVSIALGELLERPVPSMQERESEI